VPGLYSQEDLASARKHLDAALEAAAGDEVTLPRVQKVEVIFRYGEYMIAALEAAHEFKQSPTVELMQTIEESTEKAWEIYKYRYSQPYFNGIKMQKQLGVIANGFGQGEQKGGRLCWNSDETGPGDGASGWATLFIPTLDTTRPLRLEMDLWGTSDFGGIVVNTGGKRKGTSAGGIWKPVKPDQRLSGKEQWDTLVFNIPAALLAPDMDVQAVGFGGGDSQIWLSGLRHNQPDQ